MFLNVPGGRYIVISRERERAVKTNIFIPARVTSLRARMHNGLWTCRAWDKDYDLGRKKERHGKNFNRKKKNKCVRKAKLNSMVGAYFRRPLVEFSQVKIWRVISIR